MNTAQALPHPSVHARFARDLSALGAETDAQAACDALLVAHASEPRRYHTFAHVEACLGWLDWSWSLAQRPHEIAIALFFHDAVYEPLATDNEAKSAAWARDVLGRAGVAEEVLARVEAMILATRTHEASDEDTALLLDIDLAILGSSTSTFARFERDVRAEYAAIDDATYATGRARALAGFAERPAIYTTPLFRELLEDKARANITRALARWRHAA